MMIDLNNPDVRQDMLLRRLGAGEDLVAAHLAHEFSISLDTARRDLIALEKRGAARRVRGGAVPVSKPAAALRERHGTTSPVSETMIEQALAAIGSAPTLILDGGTTVQALARALPALPDRVVITPSPFIACTLYEHGIATILLPGRISEQGGIATGADATSMLAQSAADIAVLGACGLDPEFGLSSDDLLESAVKRAMALAAGRVIVMTGAEKLGRRARHKTLDISEIDTVITEAPVAATHQFVEAGLEVRHG